MPRLARELSAVEVRRLDEPGSHAVGGVSGLLLQVRDTGARSWVMRTWVGEKRRHIGLGAYPEVSLAQARDKAREVKEMVAEGIDPVERRRAARAQLVAAQRRGLTFTEAVERHLETKLSEFRNKKHRRQWKSTLDTYARPAIGDMLVADIEVGDVQRVLAPIWDSKTETASRLRGRIESVIAWATVQGHRTGDNPARWKGNLDAILPKPGRLNRVNHHPALSLAEAPKWFEELRNRKGMASRALEFMALTAARSGEVRGATWAEIDPDARLWAISADRMKAKRAHRVPLTGEALTLLDALPRFESTHFVFPAARGGMLSDMALSACMRRIHKASDGVYLDQVSGRPAVPHGLRSTFRDWTAERTDFPSDMAEIALAHQVGSDVERAYRRSDMVERRRQMMTTWARFLQGESNAEVAEMVVAP